MNGVNLGGWLVLERWMTPSLFEGTDAQDEFHFMETKGAVSKLNAHRNSFIVEEDWQWLANNNVRFVRLPVGYWALKDDGPFKTTRTYVDWAFKMAEKYDIKILLDLHALKGSQNGEMHSGCIGEVNWWRYRYESLETVNELARRYKNSPALWGIQIINEPKVWRHYFKLLWYYRRAYRGLRGILKPGTNTVFHDAFVAVLFNGALWPRKDHPVVMDSHYYLIFAKWWSKLSPEKYDARRGALYKAAISISSLFQPVIIGEWGTVLPQAMFDRTEQSEHLKMLGATVGRQRILYKKAIATAIWNYKAEGRGMYNYRSLVEDGVIT